MGDGPGESSSHMRVIVRVRPPNARERDTNHRVVVQVVDEQMLVLDPKEQAEPSFLQGRQLRQRNMLARKPKDLRFVFDRVFDETATQQEVFEGSTRSLVEGTLNGFNCTGDRDTQLFAYGATGSGKTHTMLGAPGNPGVMFHTMVSLYRHINDVRDEKRCDVAISYLEVYNEQIRDLLMPSGPLAVHEDPQKGVTVKNLTLHQPQTAEELLQMLERGNLNRTQHPTDANATSSRSHALLQIYVKQQERLAGISQSVRVAKMCLIDLAGSERATVTANRGARFREGANINRSLLALGNCINALADPKNKNQHIPYRNSKLTRLLKDSLGGNCQTIMIAAVSPSSLSLEDTYNTLKYANRAREIKTMLKSNVVSFDCHISRYAKICTELRKEVADLKAKLQAYETGPPPPRTSAVVHGAAPTAERLDRLRSVLGGVLEERRSVRQELLHVDSQLKEMALRSHQRERDQARVCLLCDDHRTVDKATGRLERCTAAARARREHMEERRRAVETRLKDNTERLRAQAAAAVLPSDEPDGALSQLLALGLSGMQHEQEAGALRECLQHAGRLARLHDTDRQHTERLVTALLRVARKQYDSLASAGLAGAEENADLEEVVRLVRRERAVVWADTAGDGDSSRDGEGDGGGGGGDAEAAAPCDGSVRSAVEFHLPGLVALFDAGEAAAPAGRDAPPAGAAPARLPAPSGPPAPSPPAVPAGSARGRKRQQPTETPARAAAPARTPEAAPVVKRAKRAVLQDPEPQHGGVRGKATRRADAGSDAEDGVYPLRPELDTSGGRDGGAAPNFAFEGGGRAPLDTTMTLGGDDDEMDAERGPGGDGPPRLGTGILRRLRLPVLGEAEGNSSQSARNICNISSISNCSISSISSSSSSSKPGYMALTTAAQGKRMQGSRSVSTSVLRETNHALRDVSAAAQRIPVETQPAKQPLRLFKFSAIGAPPPGAPSTLSRSRSVGSLAVPNYGRRKPSSFLFNLQRRSKTTK